MNYTVFRIAASYGDMWDVAPLVRRDAEWRSLASLAKRKHKRVCNWKRGNRAGRRP